MIFALHVGERRNARRVDGTVLMLLGRRYDDRIHVLQYALRQEVVGMTPACPSGT